MTIGHALLAFTLAAGILTITPGLDTALVLRTAAVEGPRRAMFAGLGICCGCLTWGFAASVGLGVLLAASHIAFTVLRVAGACYLIFLGAKMILRKSAPIRETEIKKSALSQNASAPRWLVRGLLTNLLNPKVGVFYVTFLPQFIPAGVNVTGFSMGLAGIHATESLLWFFLLTLATRPISHWLNRPRVAQTFDRVTGGLLVALGIGPVLDNR